MMFITVLFIGAEKNLKHLYVLGHTVNNIVMTIHGGRWVQDLSGG